MSNVNDRFCHPVNLEYELTVSSKSDAELYDHLFTYYPTLNDKQRKLPGYRKWRRCVIVEMLKRGLITKDPGTGPPERS